MKTAVIYTRSTEENDAAIQSQIILCKTFALKNDFKILHIYSDFKKSGIGNKLPALCKLLKDIKSCEWDSLLITDPSRLTEDPLAYFKLQFNLNMAGKRIISVIEQKEGLKQ